MFNSSIISMLFMVIFVGVGEKMAERFIPLYLSTLGAGAFIVGALNAFDNVLSALYSYPGGLLSEKYGYKRSLIFFTILAAFGFLIVVVFSSWWAVFIGSIFFISWTAISLPAIMSLINDSVPKNRVVFGVSLHSLTRRFPMALGPILGGTLISYFGILKGIRMAFFIAFLLAMISILIIYFFVKDSKKGNGVGVIVFSRFSSLFPSELKILLISDILIRFCEQLPYAFLAIWVCHNLGQSEFFFGWLTALEMFIAVLVYLPVAWFADRGNKKYFVVITFVFFTLFPITLFVSGKIFEVLNNSRLIILSLIFAFIIRGLKEFGEPTRKSMIMELAPADSKALSFGAYYMVRDVVVGLTALLSGVLWQKSPYLNFLVSSILGLIGTLIFAIYGKTRCNDSISSLKE
ncbi:MAG TPA: MFS transporter [Victivallales bacterium]|nr:MFS transporter [Victivallales bacterium]HRR27941.1 MFS transporter [Victivallales bacterium]HRU01234.1 MFS transporter [Victivallales bacterium]